MKKFRRFAFIAIGIGGLLLFIALLLWNSTRRFVARAVTAQGVVTELIEVRDNDGGSSTFKPVVKFTPRDGPEVSFESSFSSRPPAYDVGETVPVLYVPGVPIDARIQGFGSLWLGATIVSGIGAIFAAIGASILAAGRASAKKKKYLMAYGDAIQTEVQGTERDTSVKINGRSPWRITSQYLDPMTNKVRVFRSESLWFDPARFVTSKQITVLLDPQDPKRYHMDVSFLPEMEEGK